MHTPPAPSRLVFGSVLTMALLWVSLGLSISYAEVPTPEVALASQPIDLNSLYVNPYLARLSGQRADPLNVIFLGSNDVAFISHLISTVFGWREGDGTTMLFAQRGDPTPQDKQLVSQPENGRRYHIRLKAGEGSLEGQPFVLGAVHMDFTTSCGHVGREFNAARETLLNGFASRNFSIEYAYWGNMEPAQHCDGSEIASDGYIAIISVPSPLRAE